MLFTPWKFSRISVPHSTTSSFYMMWVVCLDDTYRFVTFCFVPACVTSCKFIHSEHTRSTTSGFLSWPFQSFMRMVTNWIARWQGKCGLGVVICISYVLQLRNSARYLSGFGLTDGEVMERLWSYLRRFSKMTKEMRPSHRIDILSDALLHYGRQSASNLSVSLSTSIY